MIALIHDDTNCLLGEGPLWHPERGELLWFDILARRLHRKGQHWEFESHVSAAGWIDHDRIVIASASDLRIFDLSTGKEESLCALEADNPVTRSNDGRVDPWGGFWIGTMGIRAEELARFTAGTRASCAPYTPEYPSPTQSACLMTFLGFWGKKEPLPAMPFMAGSGGGWIANSLVYQDR